MRKIVLIRHGESEWNLENRFTGWTDIDLSPTGREEALSAGRKLVESGFSFDTAYTSLLKRAIRTLWSVLDVMDHMWIPVYRSWHLNERHYGALQGLNKTDTAEKYGDDQVLKWRRSYDIRPPVIERSDERYPGHDPRYAGLKDEEIPVGESLKDTVARFLPYWRDIIVPDIRVGKHILVAAHGNSLRALVKYLENISDEDIVGVNIPTGVPLVYEVNDNVEPLKHYYLD